MINPTLFVGLGSTGLRIICRFQEIVREHYDNESIPIFQYVCLETDKRNKIEVPFWGENDIKLLYTTIPNTGLIRKNLNDEKKYLNQWIDERILRLPGEKFEDGTANIRMAGRLCLWENWGKITCEFRDAMHTIESLNNIAETEEFLKRRYKKIGKDIPTKENLVGKTPNIFITGTLCGGTCSGMFIDVGYYLKWLFNCWMANTPLGYLPRVTGLFTIMDSTSLYTDIGGVHVRRAANCWAALTEYDFWCHPDSNYRLKWPDGIVIERINEPPIDWVFLLSCTGKDANLYLETGRPDFHTLERLAAMALFTNALGKLGERILYIFGSDVIPEPEPNENEQMPCLVTCGIAAVWYPKYRIAESAAFRYSVENILKEWHGKQPDSDAQSIIGKEAKQTWKNIIEDKKRILTSRGLRGTLYDRVKKDFRENKTAFLALYPVDLIRELKTWFGELHERGSFDQEITRKERQDSFKSDILKALDEEIKGKLNSTKDVAYCHIFLGKLDDAINEEIDSLPKEYPRLDFSLSEANLVVDEWCKFVGKSKKVLNMMKTELLKETESNMILQIDNIRDFRMKPCLDAIRFFLGVKKQLPKENVEAGALSIKSKLDILEARLNSCIDIFRKRVKDRDSGMHQTRAIQVITEKQPADRNSSTISGDVEKVYFKMRENLSETEKEEIISKVLADGNTTVPFSDFWGYDNKELQLNDVLTSLHRPVFKTALGLVGGFDVVCEWSKRYDASEKRDIARFAEPHLELSGKLASHYIGGIHSVIIGKDDVYRRKLNTIENELEAKSEVNRIRFRDVLSDPELDYLLLFYKEEALLYMDENLATSAFFAVKYKKELTEGNIYGGLHTHKNGPNVFDIWVVKRRKEAKEKLVPIAREVFSVRDGDGVWNNSEIFEVENGNLILRFKREDGLVVASVGTGDPLIETLADIKEYFDYFKDKVFNRIQEIGKEGYIKRLKGHLAWIEAYAKKQRKSSDQTIDKRKQEEKRHAEIMKYAFEGE